MAIKKAKRWGDTKCGRYVSDVDRFAQVDNKDRRVSLEDVLSTSPIVEYLKDSAQRRNISVSLRFEQIFLYVMFYDLLKGVIIPNRGSIREKKAKLRLNKDEQVKFPKIYMHPLLKKLMRNDAQKRRMSVSFYVYFILIIYKLRMNISLVTSISPPIFKMIKSIKYKLKPEVSLAK